MNKPEITLSRLLGFILSVAFIWIFFFSVWYSTNIQNQENFVTTATQVLSSESVRDSVSMELVERIKEKHPIIGTVTAPLLSKVISGVLASDLFSKVYVNAATELHTQLTTKDPKPLTLEIKPTKQVISLLTQKQNPELLDKLPDNLILLERNKIPSLYKVGTLINVAGPVLLIAALITLFYLWRGISKKRTFIVVLSLVFAASGFIVYTLVPAIGGYLQASANSANVANIIYQVYAAFTHRISEVALNVLFFGLLVAFLAKFLKRGVLQLPKSTK